MPQFGLLNNDEIQRLLNLYGTKASEKELNRRLNEKAQNVPTEELLTALIGKQENNQQISPPQSQAQQQSQPEAGSFWRKLGTALMMGGAGLQGQDPAQILNNLMAAQERQKGITKGVYGFDPLTGKVTHEAEIPESAELRVKQAATGVENLPFNEQPIARALARKLYGVRGAEKGLPAIVNARLSGISFDVIEDSIRFSTQSPEFSMDIRNAAQTISIKDTESIRNANFDALDDYIQQGDMGGARDYLKRMAVTNAPTAAQAQNVMGQERTIELLDEIKDDLQILENEGFPTGFWTGRIDKLMDKIGQIKNPAHMEITTRIAIALFQYRRDMTGVQFGMKEHAEYKAVFPDIDKVNALNMARIKGLVNVFGGNLDRFYSQSMGTKNYKKIFQGQTYKEQISAASNSKKPMGWTQEKENRLQELRKKSFGR